MAEQAPSTPEPPRSPERPAPYRAMTGLQTRLLIDPSFINPKVDVPEVKPEHFLSSEERSHSTYDLLNTASKRERKEFWEKKGEGDFEKQKKAWGESTVNTFQNAKEFFSSTQGKGKEWREIFSHMGIHADNFTAQQAEELYDRYFSGEKPAPPINLFLQDVVDAHTISRAGKEAVDWERLKNNLPAVRWMAGIFGGNSSEIIEQLVDAEMLLQTNPQSLIERANEVQTDRKNPEEKALRVNNLEDREEQLLSFLWNAQEADTSPTPRPTPPTEPPPGTTPPDETPSSPSEEATPHEDWEKLKNTYRFASEGSWQNATDIRNIFVESEIAKQNLPVYYPGAGFDISYPLAFTDAQHFVFDDYVYINEDGSPRTDYFPDTEIVDIGGVISDVKTEGVLGQGGKRIVTFDWGGKTRTVTMYAEDASKFVPDELNNTMSFLVIKAPTPQARGQNITEETIPGQVWEAKSLGTLLDKLAVGGFYHNDPRSILPYELLGFKKLIDKGPVDGLFGRSSTSPLFQKEKQVQHLQEILQIDYAALVGITLREGAYTLSVDDVAMQGYKTESLEKIRATYDTLPPETKETLKEPLKALLFPERFSEQELKYLRQYGLTTDEVINNHLQRVHQIGKEVFPELAA